MAGHHPCLVTGYHHRHCQFGLVPHLAVQDIPPHLLGTFSQMGLSSLHRVLEVYCCGKSNRTRLSIFCFLRRSIGLSYTTPLVPLSACGRGPNCSIALAVKILSP